MFYVYTDHPQSTGYLNGRENKYVEQKISVMETHLPGNTLVAGRRITNGIVSVAVLTFRPPPIIQQL